MALVTLSTDIGSRDFIIGAFKGQMLSMEASLQIVDITHQLSSSNFAEVAYICQHAFKYFPDNSIHVILTNMFEFDFNHILLAKYGEQFVLCPDNGILTMLVKQMPSEVFKIALPNSAASNTMQFLAVIASAIQKLAKGKYPIQIGERFDKFVERYPMRPTFGDEWIEGQIIYIDKFENVVVNISKDEFEECRKGRNFNISFGRNNTIDSILANYAASNDNEYMACFNSANMLELSIKGGNMAGLFGLQGFKEESQNSINNITQNSAKRNSFYQTIRIYFENNKG